MAIPESQLDTWAKQGSVTGSSATYNAIKNTLNDSGSPYYDKTFSVFLQGSYGNDTNIYSESDVDLVIQLHSTFQYDLGQLTENQKALFSSAFATASYGYPEFKKDVLAHLQKVYGSGVKGGNKAIMIPATNNRRKADVIVALEYRKYTRFYSAANQTYVEGIKFYTSNGDEIINYPKPHSSQLTSKHQSTSSWFKPVVRVFKNLRSRLESKEKLSPGDAPSYYLEGLLHNVPSDKFSSSHGDCFCNAINWIQAADKTQFLCAHQQYYLLRNGHHVCWEPAKCDKFLAAAVELWNGW